MKEQQKESEISWKKAIENMDLGGLKLRRINTCIKVQQRVVDNKRTFSMWRWQDMYDHPDWAHKTEKGLHTCGTAACFGGHLAVSPEWKRAGGGSNYEGAPEYKGKSYSKAIQKYLGLSDVDAYRENLGFQLTEPGSSIYAGLTREITSRNVLTRLKYAKEVAIKQRA